MDKGKIVNIKSLKKGDKIRFLEHSHTIANYWIDCSNMFAKVNFVHLPNKKDNRHQIDIKLKNKTKYKSDLFEWENSLVFLFPDNEEYNDIKVKLIQ